MARPDLQEDSGDPGIRPAARRRRWVVLTVLLVVAGAVAAAVWDHRRADAPADARPPVTGSRELPTVAADAVNCAATPSSCGFPDATNTGVPPGTALQTVDGGLTVTEAGTVIEGKDIRGCVAVEAPDVTIRRSKVTCTDFTAITSWRESYSGGGLLVEDVEIDCQHTNGTGVGSYGLVARRLNIHGCENGFDIDDSVTVEDSYIHDLYEGSSGHADGIQLAGGAHITIQHNTIFSPGGTSAIISHPDRNSDVLVAGNLLAGGAYTLYCPEHTSADFRVIANRFSARFYDKGGAYGPWVYCEKVAEARDNVWDSDLRSLN